MRKVTLFTIFLLALVLRFVYWPEGITFHYDQAKDAVFAYPIWQGEDLIKLNGPAAIIPGLATGPLFYYFLALTYFLGKGNPAFPSLFLISINCLAVFLLYHLAKSLFRKRTTALLSSFLFTVSFEATQVARWLSNPSPAILALLLAFLGFWHLVADKKSGLILAAIGIGLAIHLDLYFFYLFFLGFIYAFVFKKKNKNKDWFYYFLIVFIFVLPTILQQFKNNFLGVRSSWQFLQGNKGRFLFPLFYSKNFLKIFKYNFFPHSLPAGILGILLISGSILYCFKKPETRKQRAVLFLLLWFFSTLPLHFFNLDPVTAGYVNLGINISAILLFVFWLDYLKIASYLKYLLIILVFLSNFYLIIKENKNGNVLFSVQKKMILGDQLKVIDYTYQSSGGKEFSINTLTLPLNINLVWEYHYWWYGRHKYGYLPAFVGSQQFGWHKLSWSPKRENFHYAISEPQRGIARYFVDYFFGKENEETKVLEENNFGNFIVQERILK